MYTSSKTTWDFHSYFSKAKGKTKPEMKTSVYIISNCIGDRQRLSDREQIKLLHFPLQLEACNGYINIRSCADLILTMVSPMPWNSSYSGNVKKT